MILTLLPSEIFLSMMEDKEYTGMGIVCENAHFLCSKIDFLQKQNSVCRKIIWVQKKKESINLAFHWMPLNSHMPCLCASTTSSSHLNCEQA